jgi:hypothetical protein
VWRSGRDSAGAEPSHEVVGATSPGRCRQWRPCASPRRPALPPARNADSIIFRLSRTARAGERKKSQITSSPRPTPSGILLRCRLPSLVGRFLHSFIGTRSPFGQLALRSFIGFEIDQLDFLSPQPQLPSVRIDQFDLLSPQPQLPSVRTSTATAAGDGDGCATSTLAASVLPPPLVCPPAGPEEAEAVAGEKEKTLLLLRASAGWAVLLDRRRAGRPPRHVPCAGAVELDRGRQVAPPAYFSQGEFHRPPCCSPATDFGGGGELQSVPLELSRC